MQGTCTADGSTMYRISIWCQLLSQPAGFATASREEIMFSCEFGPMKKLPKRLGEVARTSWDVASNMVHGTVPSIAGVCQIALQHEVL